MPAGRPRRPVGPFGRRLDRLARARGWTQRRLARALGLAESTVCRLMRGAMAPPRAWVLAVRTLERELAGDLARGDGDPFADAGAA